MKMTRRCVAALGHNMLCVCTMSEVKFRRRRVFGVERKSLVVARVFTYTTGTPVPER